MGSVVLSIDAELGWGFHDLADPPTDRVEAGRPGWRVTLAALEEYEVPATWAIVGHLFLEDCDGRHADHPTPTGWFSRERGAWARRPDLRFGPDLVEAVCDSPVAHEVASHSFSHVLFGQTDRRLARAECERAQAIAADWGLEVDSFVFPRNDVGHLDVLAATGFRAYRGRSPTPDGVRGLVAAEAGDRGFLVRPSVDEHGLVNVPASQFLFGFEGPARSVATAFSADPMVVQARRGIEAAAREDGLCHLWFHPNNLTAPRDARRLRAVLSTIDRYRETTDLRVETMADVADRVEPSDEPAATVRCSHTPL